MSLSHDSTVAKSDIEKSELLRGNSRNRNQDNSSSNSGINFSAKGQSKGTFTSKVEDLNRENSSIHRTAKDNRINVARQNKNGTSQIRKGGGNDRGGQEEGVNFGYDFSKKQLSDRSRSYSIGEFLYRLHFFSQLNQVPIKFAGIPFGYFLSGIVSFLFLFAIITGTFLHWEKIKSNFFIFRPWSKWKTVWTDIHTGLGVIQLPFQFIFAVTGIVLVVNSVLTAPYTEFLYNGDRDKLNTDVQSRRGGQKDPPFEYSYHKLDKAFDLSRFLNDLGSRWDTHNYSRIAIKNYGDKNMHLIIQAVEDPKINFSSASKLTYRVRDDKIIQEKLANNAATYVETVKNLIYRLHFGNFGKTPVLVIYFILGIMGCVVILSGAMIWFVARDKKQTAPHKRKFNFWATNVFLAVCLSMLPVTAFAFIMIKILGNVDQTGIYQIYFYSWLALSTYFTAIRNFDRLNRQSLILSAMLCFLVPISNGIFGGKWIWVSLQHKMLDILLVDVLFFTLSILTGIIYFKIRSHNRFSESQKKEIIETNTVKLQSGFRRKNIKVV
jgi:hypothetical protein